MRYVHLAALGTPPEGRLANRRREWERFWRIVEEKLASAEAEFDLRRLQRSPQAAPSCLLCYEADWRVCHRRRIAEILVQRHGFAVRHLSQRKSYSGAVARESRRRFERTLWGRIMQITKTISSRRSCSAFACWRPPSARLRGTCRYHRRRSRRSLREWRGCGFLRDNDPQEAFGTPIIYANGQPVARSEPGAAAFRDIPPGTYRFTVQSFGHSHRLQGQGPARSRARRPISRSNGARAGWRAKREATPSMCERCHSNWAKAYLQLDALCRPGANPIVIAGSLEIAMSGRTMLFAGSLLGDRGAGGVLFGGGCGRSKTRSSRRPRRRSTMTTSAGSSPAGSDRKPGSG